MKSLFRAMGGQVKLAYDSGYETGKSEATAIVLPESSYGATQPALVAVEFKSFQELRSCIRAKRGYRSGDNPGQAYMWTCELIHIHHGDYEKVAILKCATHYDI